MIIFFIIICFILIGLLAFSCVRVSEKDKRATKGSEMLSKCNKCKTDFVWNESDPILQIGFCEYVVKCPHCNKLTKVTKIP